MDKSTITIKDVVYTGRKITRLKQQTTSICVIGLDTEAYNTGEMFMTALSDGSVFRPEEIPACFFSRQYRGANFVAYNLKYDEGALLQWLPMPHLQTLREQGKCYHNGYRVTVIPGKCLTFARGKNSIHVWDMYNFYTGSLDYNAQKYLGEQKIEIETKTFAPDYVSQHWDEIARYCVHDAVLVQKLGQLLIRKFESYGVYPRKLYSTAYVSFQYFRQHTNYVTVYDIWHNDKQVLDYAMQAYNGGKFEVTRKGCDYYYEYDIVSAYPYEIANLVDITHAHITWDRRYQADAVYGFIRVRMKIPVECYSPVAVKYYALNRYPVGEIEKTITKSEYDYLLRYGADITIVQACWFFVNYRQYPYRRRVKMLMQQKDKYKREGRTLDYHTIKIFLNSFYGKMVQLIKKRGKMYASTCWNPIYGAVITANVRVKISEMQAAHDSVVAVHTDSIISTEALQYPSSGGLGDMVYECEGQGVIIGSGVYQIGDKVRFRGFDMSTKLLDICDTPGKKYRITNVRALTWKEVAFHNWTRARINRFETQEKELRVDFDCKRLWLDDYTTFRQVKKRHVYSSPFYNTFRGL